MGGRDLFFSCVSILIWTLHEIWGISKQIDLSRPKDRLRSMIRWVEVFRKEAVDQKGHERTACSKGGLGRWFWRASLIRHHDRERQGGHWGICHMPRS